MSEILSATNLNHVEEYEKQLKRLPDLYIKALCEFRNNKKNTAFNNFCTIIKFIADLYAESNLIYKVDIVSEKLNFTFSSKDHESMEDVNGFISELLNVLSQENNEKYLRKFAEMISKKASKSLKEIITNALNSQSDNQSQKVA